MTQETFSTLIGRTLTAAENRDNEEIVFTCDTGEQFRLAHYQDCCESVRIAEIVGSLEDLVGVPILMADESSSTDVADWPKTVEQSDYLESFTWTFYKLGTIKGYVDIRWLGESNGYYSEGVDFSRIHP